MAISRNSQSTIANFNKYNRGSAGFTATPEVGLWLIDRSSGTAVLSSSDAFTWTSRTTLQKTGGDRCLQAYNGRIYMYSRNENLASASRSSYSTNDGINFEYGDLMSSPASGGYVPGATIYDPVRKHLWMTNWHSNLTFTFSLVYTGEYWTRTNGVGVLRDIILHNTEIFVCFSSATGTNPIQRSTNGGKTWTSVAPGSGLQFFSMASNGTRIVAAGDGSNIYHSTNGTTWTTGPAVNGFASVRFLNGNFVCVAANGQILTSPDGVTWTSRTSGTTNRLRDVAFGNGVYAICGDSGTILTSTNLSTWTSRTSGTTDNLLGIAYV